MVALKRVVTFHICPDHVAGSRNAVVALKLRRSRKRLFGSCRKQERRGGIETSLRHFRYYYCFTEAGTPWWH